MKKILIISILLFAGCISVVDVGPPGTQPVKPLPKTAGGLPFLSQAIFVNTNTFSWSDLQGKKILIAFFDFNNNDENQLIPSLNNWYRQYNRRNVEIVGIHVPAEREFFSLAKLRKTIAAKRIKFPVIVDSDHLIWAGLERYDLVRVDALGFIQQKYAEPIDPLQVTADLENQVKQERGAAAILEPDILCGAEKGKIGNSADMHAYVPFTFTQAGNIPVAGVTYLNGVWTARQKSYFYEGPAGESSIAFRFYSPNVSILAQRGRVKVILDDRPISPSYQGEDIITDGSGNTYVQVSAKRLYNVARDLPWPATPYTIKLYPEGEFEIFRILFPIGDNWKLQ
ncbi:MAG: redoxin domain-containing protein [bacterium]|nr:redoxin domain-containing protein [bacterium]MDD5354347.1 redoxin domain-containing protein [bacterium]MDD5755795.1 redoxin domain-containing protein [bacterium]